jgi:eukaryotic-like serine/threonine-protein kinase
VKQPGEAVGPYRIVGVLGTGGMGEVYRAHDARLLRDVALKLLPEPVAADPEFLSRFEREAQSTSALNHPNVVTVYGAGQEGGTLYIAMELIEGQTLRELLSEGRLSLRKLTEIARQVSDGLAVAHARGIVHRDLKPENVMVTHEGLVKILDFGLAKLTASVDVDPDGSTRGAPSAKTGAGTILGTVAYMSPEQASGNPVDFHSDQFSFGAILYEMLAGRPAFRRDTAAETLTAILREDPAPFNASEPHLAAPVRWIVERCLAKDPEDRYASTRDLVHDLSNLRHELSRPAQAPAPASSRFTPERRTLLLVGLAALAVGAAAGALALAMLRPARTIGPPVFEPVSFERGTIWAGRFAPDGRTIFYAAAWEGHPFQILRKAPETYDSVPISFPPADILAVSPQGEIAALVDVRAIMPGRTIGTLAMASSMGVAPRRLLENVEYADWGPDGRSLAIVHDVGGQSVLEYPIGTARHSSAGWISHPRVARDGKTIAFLEHPIAGDDRAAVRVLDAGGKARTLSDGWNTAHGLAWSPDEKEVWVSGTSGVEPAPVYAVSLTGGVRPVVRTAGNVRLLDVAADGRMLVSTQDRKVGISFRAGDGSERNLSLLGASVMAGLSADGTAVLFTEAGTAGGFAYSACLRKTDGSPPVRLGDGMAQALSPDQAWALVLQVAPSPQLVLVPTGPGQARTIDSQGLGTCHQSSFLPDGKRIVSACSEEGHGTRLYVYDLAGGKPRAISPEGIVHGLQPNPVSPDGKWVAAVGPDWQIHLYSADGGEERPVRGTAPGVLPIRFTKDGRQLYVARVDQVPAKILKVDPTTGVSTLWKTLMPADPAGVQGFPAIALSEDGNAMAYSYARFLSDLYVITGAR